MESTPLFELQIDQDASSYLHDAARWAKFLSVMGFVFCGLFVIVALLMGSLFSDLANTLGTSSGVMGGGVIAALYIGIAIINFFPCLYLYNFSTKMKMALRNNDQDLLTRSFKSMRACYRFVGILMIIALCFWVLALAGMIFSFAFRGIR